MHIWLQNVVLCNQKSIPLSKEDIFKNFEVIQNAGVEF